MSNLLLGKPVVEKIYKSQWVTSNKPFLSVCLVGENEASKIYVQNKKKACERNGLGCDITYLSDSSNQNSIIDLIQSWNESKDIHGILIQLPLPTKINRNAVLNAVSPNKDVDGFHSLNLGKLVQSSPEFLPCTAMAVLEMLFHYEIEILGQHVVIINDTVVVGRPLAMLLSNHGATVTLCNRYTKSLKEICATADILVSAVGKRPDFVLSDDYVKPGAVVIDIGITRLNGKVIGDVDFEQVSKKTAYISPVPGGVGPCTIACLMRNLAQAAYNLETNR